MSKIDIIDRDGWRNEFPLQEKIVYIGSQVSDDNISLAATRGAGVSPLHAQLVAWPTLRSGYRLVNLSSTDIVSSSLSDPVIPPRNAKTLADGEAIQLGEFTLNFSITEEHHEQPSDNMMVGLTLSQVSPDSDQSSDTTARTIEIIDGDGWRKVYPLDKSIIYIGTAYDNDIILGVSRGGDVAPRHAQLTVLPNNEPNYRLANLADADIIVSGATETKTLSPRSSAYIAPGDQVSLGDFILNFHVVTAPCLEVMPNRPLEGHIVVRNLGEMGDVAINLIVDGLISDCYEVGPAPPLPPASEQRVSFRIVHTKKSQPAAGRRRFQIEATAPQTYPGESATVSQQIDIEPYYRHSLRLVRLDEDQARYQLEIHNQGNVLSRYQIRAEDLTAALKFQFLPQSDLAGPAVQLVSPAHVAGLSPGPPQSPVVAAINVLVGERPVAAGPSPSVEAGTRLPLEILPPIQPALYNQRSAPNLISTPLIAPDEVYTVDLIAAPIEPPRRRAEYHFNIISRSLGDERDVQQVRGNLSITPSSWFQRYVRSWLIRIKRAQQSANKSTDDIDR